MGRVLVTGAAGWLGQSLVAALVSRAEGQVRRLVLGGQQAPPAPPGVETIAGDLRSPEACARLCEGGAETLYHCAGVIHPSRIREFYEINVRGTANLLEAAARAKVRRAVLVSSNSPCGCNPHPGHLFDEDSPYDPYLNYGRSKMLMELAARDLQSRGDIETVILRVPWFYGPRQPARQSLFFRMVREGRAPLVGSGENRRSMAYIDNICDALILAAGAKSAGGRTYWIADTRPYAFNEILSTIEEVLRDDFGLPVTGRRLRLPGFIGPLAWATDWLIQGAGFYQQKVHVLSELDKEIACSVEAARHELGYEPKIALREGMHRSIAWCIDSGVPI